MLADQLWMKYAPDLEVEWKQAKYEGKDVDQYEAACKEIAEAALSDDLEQTALEMGARLSQAPLAAPREFDEPSDWAGIRRSLPDGEPVSKPTFDEEQLADKIAGGWAGRIAGCLLGKPVEGFRREKLLELLQATGNYPMSRYITTDRFTDDLIARLDLNMDATWADKIGLAAPLDDDTNYSVLALKMLEKYGPDFTPGDVAESWLSWVPMFDCCTAERVAYRNIAMGLCPPDTATLNNPYREWIGAQIRGDVFGYINPGDPGRAAEMAWRDASVSHIKNGIYGEMYVAAMIAGAYMTSSPTEVVGCGLAKIPPRSRLKRDIDTVLRWYADGVSGEQAIDRIHELYDDHDVFDWCYTNPNAMIVTAALLHGDGDFGGTICLAVQGAFDTDCNGATAGSIAGVMLGLDTIPDYWYLQYHSALETSIMGFPRVTIAELTERTLRLIEINQ